MVKKGAECGVTWRSPKRFAVGRVGAIIVSGLLGDLTPMSPPPGLAPVGIAVYCTSFFAAGRCAIKLIKQANIIFPFGTHDTDETFITALNY